MLIIFWVTLLFYKFSANIMRKVKSKLIAIKFRVCKSVHLHTFKRINSNQMQQLIVGLFLVV
jgi:hypothetical protein